MNKENNIIEGLAYLPDEVEGQINIHKIADYNEYYEKLYYSISEPWQYSKRGAELYRHSYTVEKIEKYQSKPKNVLELACSKGLMSALLLNYSLKLYLADISIKAVRVCKEYIDKINVEKIEVNFFITTAPGLPFKENFFDVITVCDGLGEWHYDDEKFRNALDDIYNKINKEGIAVFTDYINPQSDGMHFKNYISKIANSPFSIIDISFLYDRPWYLFEALVKKMQLNIILQKVLESIPLAKKMNKLGKMFGERAARHIVIVAKKL